MYTARKRFEHVGVPSHIGVKFERKLKILLYFFFRHTHSLKINDST